MDLGTRLKELRTNRMLSQQQVSDALGVNRVTYSQYEVNRREPGIKTLQTMASFYNVSLDYLTGYTDDSFSPKDIGKDIVKNICDSLDLSLLDFFDEKSAFLPSDLIQLLETAQKLSPEDRKKFHELMQSFLLKNQSDETTEEVY
jgi:transcriptional regulator with XRE-family HTH domain